MNSMSKLFRAASTVMIAVGLAYLFMYTQSQNVDKLTILEQPSYYAVQSLWLMFIAGIVAILFGILGSFFSWFKKMDPEKEALPNAGYATDKDIHTWVSGEADSGAEVGSASPAKGAQQQTEVLDKTTELLTESTEILPDEEGGGGAKACETEILRREDEV